jgi:hypothetical protein
MGSREQYSPGAACGAELRKDGQMWTLVLVRNLSHPLTLWHSIDRGFISMGAAGWHFCFDVLGRLLADRPIGRIVGADAIKFGSWQRLNAEYAKQFGIEPPEWPSRPRA